MLYPNLTRANNGVFVLNLGPNQNRLDTPYCLTFLEHLDVVEANEGPTALVIMSSSTKFFSNGLSFEALEENPKKFLSLVHRVLLRLLICSVPTVAAINGHAFAAGAMIAFCCDYRVMNHEKGYICVNEVELGFPLTPGLAAIVKAKADRSQWINLMLNAKRFDAAEALRCKLVDVITSPDNVQNEALKIAIREAIKGENKVNYKGLKEETYPNEISILKASLMGHADAFAERMGFKAKL